MTLELINEDKRIEEACLRISYQLSKIDNITKESFLELKKKICSELKLSKLPKNSQILSFLNEESKRRLKDILKVKPVRTASGIAVIGVMAKPYPCPHGTCIYCPGGVSWGTPQSYTGKEPATMRALQFNFDPYLQITSRIKQLTLLGHEVDKAEVIILGGTFLNTPLEYQYEFVKACYDALNGEISFSLEEAKRKNEKAKVRMVGLTIETKPDWCKERHVNLMLNYGVTRVEIGVQALDDEILKFVNRGHNLKDVVEAFRIAKDAGYKIVAHMMPGLPKSNPQKDFEFFEKLFYDERFKPDMIKIYPTLVIEKTGLHKLYLKGEYKPYPLDTMVDLIAKVKKMVPYWVRIMRIQREIPSHEIVDGVKKGNLRELALKKLAEEGLKCRCIRCREIGLNLKDNSINNVKLFREDYFASEGKEVFLSFEDEDRKYLIGFLRLRLPSYKAHREEVKDSAIVRELHVFGDLVPIGDRREKAWQHKGFGKKLMKEAERIAKEEWGVKKLLVISAVGTREYYRKLGYELFGPYMAKDLKVNLYSEPLL